MAELRSVDPSSLVPNPDNPRRTPVPPVMDEQLLASINAVGILQLPLVREKEGRLEIIDGHRRRNAAIAAGLVTIHVVVCDADDTADAMRSVSANLIRASMTSVDIWRATATLEAQGWTEQAIADALALPVRTIKRLKLLAHLHPAMLDVMATGNMPNEDQLRTIAAASRDEQAQVWKKYRPRKGHDVAWYEIARALSKRRIPFSAAKFDDALAQGYGVVWEDDLFAPAGEDGRYTINVEGFFGAQQEWLQDNLPERGTLLPSDEYGRAQLPKKAEHVYGKPGKHDLVGHYLDSHSGEVRTIVYRVPEPKKPAKAGKGGEAAGVADDITPPTRTRPEVTQKGSAMIGDLRTDALHQALREATIDDSTLLALLVLALGGKNVTVSSGAGVDGYDRQRVAAGIAEGGVLTSDQDAVRAAARSMLTITLSCRDNRSNSGPLARVAGDAIGASLYLPNMATEEFLSCLSKAAVERAAATEDVRVEARAKDTRARLIERFKSGIYVYPAAVFKLTAKDLARAKDAEPRRYVAGAGWSDPESDDPVGDEAGEDRQPGEMGDGADAFDAGPRTDTDDGDAGDAGGAIAAE
ncbi:MAG: ParB/RepB/Spo0J family partition protein [Alphaproteobacteria bacterium]|nr:ParB/RepB/Spo0J family partition protein [Alphaproteobacteria bacterium]